MSTRVLSITPERFASLRQSGQTTVLLDVRTDAEYRAGHAEGARLVSLDEIDPRTLPGLIGNPNVGRYETLYVTCQSGARARQAAERLADAGYHNLAVIEGGTQAWEQAGLPMVRCGTAIALDRQVQIAVGSLLVLKVILGFTIHEIFFAAIPLIGIGLVVAGLTRWCGMADLLARMPWNRPGRCLDQAAA
jgi:rhodanese-related sulfurtransferase